MASNVWPWSRPLAVTTPAPPSTYRKAADFVHEHADYYDREMEIYLRERAAEFGTPSG